MGLLWLLFCAAITIDRWINTRRLSPGGVSHFQKACRRILNSVRAGENGVTVGLAFFPREAMQYLPGNQESLWLREAADTLMLALRSGRPLMTGLREVDRGLDDMARLLRDSRRSLTVTYWKWLLAITAVCWAAPFLLSEGEVGEPLLFWAPCGCLVWAGLSFHVVARRIPGLWSGGRELDGYSRAMSQWLATCLMSPSETAFTKPLDESLGRFRNELESLTNWLPVAELLGLGGPAAGILCLEKVLSIWGT